MSTDSTTGQGQPSPLTRLKAIAAGDSFAAEVERLLHTTAEINGRVDWMHGRLSDLEAEALRWGALEAELPGLMHAVSVTTGALRRLRRELTDLESLRVDNESRAERIAESVHELWEYVRLVRAEVLHEIRAGVAPGSTHEVETLVHDPGAIRQLADAGALRVNLGCGHIALEGYVNVDMRPLPGVDVVAVLDDLPFEQSSVSEVYSAHVLEHFTVHALEQHLIPHWREVLAPGGTFRAVVPDAEAMALGLAEGTVTFSDYAAVLMGGQEYEGDFHFSAFSAESLTDLLERSGFADVTVLAEGRRNDIALELDIKATRK